MSQTLTYVIGQDRRAHVDDVQNFKVNFDGGNSNWVQARQYERSMRQVFVNIKNEDGTPFDLTGCNVWFEGLLPKNSNGDFRIIDDKGYVALDPSAGRFRFDMPGHAFTVAGSYRQAFFRIIKDGNSVTTLEFDLDVLADKVIDGLVPRTYISPVEELIDEIEAKYQDSTDKLTKMTSDFVDKFTQTMNTLKALGTTVQNGLDALDQKIKEDGLFTQAEADTFKQAIKKEIAKLKLPDVINIKEFGAVGDGLTDDSAVFQKAINTGEEIFIPNGTYEVDTTLVPKDESTPLVMHGQTPGKVIFKSTQSKVMDFTSSKNLVMSNISSDKVMGIIDYDPDNKTNDHTQDRFIQLDNIWNTSAGTKMINWDHLVVTPKMDEDPLAGDINNHSGKYARYPLEIYNNGGFNALNINNGSQSVEASAIGITDNGGKEAPSSTPTIFIIQHGNRAYMKVLNSGMDKPAFEGSGSSIAIGAEVSTSDHGVANLKIGSHTWPTISLIERDSDKAGSITYSNDKLMFFTDGGKDVLDIAKDGLTTGKKIQINTEDPIGYTIVRNGHVKTLLLDSNGRMRLAGSFSVSSDLDAQLVQVCQSGPSEERPALKNAPNDIGFRYFDRSLGKPVFWDGINWVTADGIKAYGAIDAEPADNAEH